MRGRIASEPARPGDRFSGVADGDRWVARAAWPCNRHRVAADPAAAVRRWGRRRSARSYPPRSIAGSQGPPASPHLRLECGHEHMGEPHQVGVTAQVAAGAHRLEPGPERVAPTKGSSMPAHNPTPELAGRNPKPRIRRGSKPRFDRWIIDACTRPLDQDWLNYQHEIGLRHTSAKKTKTDNADSLNHIPMRYLLAFSAVVIATAREYLAATGAPPEQVDRMHSAFTKSVMLQGAEQPPASCGSIDQRAPSLPQTRGKDRRRPRIHKASGAASVGRRPRAEVRTWPSRRTTRPRSRMGKRARTARLARI